MKTTFRNVLIFIICLLIIGTVVDFINWRTALDIIKKEIPMQGINVPAFINVKGFGYVPFVWRSGPLSGQLILLATPDGIQHPITGAIHFQIQRKTGFDTTPIENGTVSFHIDRVEGDLNYQDFYLFVVPIDSKIQNKKYVYGNQPHWEGTMKLLLVYEIDTKEYFKFVNFAWLQCYGAWTWDFWK